MKRLLHRLSASARPRRAPSRGEAGFLLLGIMSMILVMGILSGALVQDWSIVEKREREAQLIFIQEQFASAIADYQKGQGALPTDLKQLLDKGQKNELYLRRPWTDPMTRGAKYEDWCLLKLAGTGQVASSCDTEGDGSGEGEGGKSAFGFSKESGASERERGIEKRGQQKPSRLDSMFGGTSAGASGFQIGQETAPPQQRNIPGLAPGTAGIVGVCSKSSDRSYNTVKFDADTYDKWYYTVEQYKKDISMRNIPGMPSKGGPGLGNKSGNPNQPGGPGAFGGDPFSPSPSGSGSKGGRRGSSSGSSSGSSGSSGLSF